MATRGRKSSPSEAAHIRFFVADDIRLERDGKVTAVGLYTDQVIIAISDQETVPEGTHLTIGGLSFLFSISGLEGTKQVSLKYFDESTPRSDPTIGDALYAFPTPTSSVNIVVRFQQFSTGSYGLKRVLIRVGEHEEEFCFEVRRSTQAALRASAVRVAKSLRPKVASKSKTAKQSAKA